MTDKDKRLSRRSIIAIEGSLATVLGFMAGAGITLFLWIMEWCGWERDSVFHDRPDIHILPENIRTNGFVIVAVILAGALIGAVIGGYMHVRRLSRPWRPSWKGRDD